MVLAPKPWTVTSVTRLILTVTYSNKDYTYLLEPGETSIGRSHKNKIQINHPEVSRIQAIVFCTQEGRVKLVDGNGSDKLSRNGTFVNKAQIKTCWLCSGDTIHFGSGEVVAGFKKVNVELSSEDPVLDELIQTLTSKSSEDEITDHPSQSLNP